MNRIKQDYFFSTILLLFIIFFSYLTLINTYQMNEYMDYKYFLINDESTPLNSRSAKTLLNDNNNSSDPLTLLFWSKNKVQVSFEELSRTEYSNSYHIIGNSKLLFPEQKLMLESDVDQTIISSNLALKLFGNSTNKKKYINYKNKKYEVIDVVNSDDNYFIVQANDDDINTFKQLIVKGTKYQNDKLMQQNLSNKLNSSVKLIDYKFYFVLIIVINSLLLFIVAIIILIIVCDDVKNINYRFEYFYLLFVVFILVFFFIKNLPSINEYLPDQLSDFDFFLNLSNDFKLNFKSLINIEKTPLEVDYLREVTMSTVITIFSIVCLFVFGLHLGINYLLIKEENHI